jgi:ribosomal protein S27AE
MAIKGKKYCNRCGHEMWYDEEKKRWYCTNPKCVKYKEPPASVKAAMAETADDK